MFHPLSHYFFSLTHIAPTSHFCKQALTLIARAHHDAAEHMEARRALQRGLHQFPTDMKLRFNLGFVLQV